jgi:hypothetical protein
VPPPLEIALAPDTGQFAALLRILARHLADAADEIEHLIDTTATQESARP